MNSMTAIEISEDRIRRNRERRNRELRRHIFMAGAAAAAVIFSAVFALTSAISDAKESRTEPLYKYYRVVTVLPGDTVEDAAEIYLTDAERSAVIDESAYAAEIRSINHLSYGEQPLAATKLVIPYYSAEFLE